MLPGDDALPAELSVMPQIVADVTPALRSGALLRCCITHKWLEGEVSGIDWLRLVAASVAVGFPRAGTNERR
jgi:hypothetical protein